MSRFGVVEPDSLEVLKRRARGHKLEVVVEGRKLIPAFLANPLH